MTTSTEASTRPSGNWGEFIRFIATGGLCGITNLATRFTVDAFASFEFAILAGYLVGMVIAFVLFQRTIFGDPGTSLRQQMLRFTAVNLFGLILTLVISLALARLIFPAINWTFRSHDIAHFFGVCAPAFSSYLLHKHYTYR